MAGTHFFMLKKNLTSKLLLQHDLMKQACLLASNQILLCLFPLIPHQTAIRQESLAVDGLTEQFFHVLQSKKYVITPTALRNMHTAKWVEFNRTERLEFAQMPTAGDEVEAGLR
jgi:hypothetical protein